MNEGTFLLGSLAPGRGFVLGLVGVLVVFLAVRVLIHRRHEPGFVGVTRPLERWLLTAFLLALVLLSAFQIVYRNVFGSGFIWIDPLLRSLVLWLTFLGAFAATAEGRHIGIDIVGRLLPETPRKALFRLLSALAAAVCIALANGAYEYLSLEKEFEADAFLGLATWHVQSILLLGFILLAYRFLVAAVLGVRSEDEAGRAGEPAPGPGEIGSSQGDASDGAAADTHSVGTEARSIRADGPRPAEGGV
ncbi:MAG: TRAP transporter small permease [Candidatus Eisenbacteria bacterium]